MQTWPCIDVGSSDHSVSAVIGTVYTSYEKDDVVDCVKIFVDIPYEGGTVEISAQSARELSAHLLSLADDLDKKEP